VLAAFTRVKQIVNIVSCAGWFEGLSTLFLSSDVPKLLLLAGVDRLDKALTVGQMQGKFQLHVMPQSGHAIHEDLPDKVRICMQRSTCTHIVIASLLSWL
jgi:protein phosphatase methylesterase 1